MNDNTFIELIKGMQITGKHLGKHAVTLQYPKERMEMFERSRGIVVLLSDKETGELNCTACMLCMKICPTAAIRIDAPMDENKRKQLKTFTVDNALCCFCGLCEEACNFDAIKLAGKYEWSTESIDDTMWDIKKLQEVGLDVPYEVTRKKKPVKKVAKKKPEDDAAAKKDDAKAADKPAEKSDDKPKAEAAADKSAEKTEQADKPEAKEAPQEQQKPDEDKKPAAPETQDDSSTDEDKKKD